VAGAHGRAGHQDTDDARSALFNYPYDIAIAQDGSIIVSDLNNHCIRMIKGRQVSTIAGRPGNPGTRDGPPGTATFTTPSNLLCHEDRIYVSDHRANNIRVLTIPSWDPIRRDLATNPTIDKSNCVKLLGHALQYNMPSMAIQAQQVIADNFPEIWANESNHLPLLNLSYPALRLVFTGLAEALKKK